VTCLRPAALLLVALASCQAAPPPAGRVSPGALMDAERRAAVMTVGATVCRSVPVGTAERDWIRGRVVAVADRSIGVRVDDAGRYPHELDGVRVTKGARLPSDPAAWVPCR